MFKDLEKLFIGLDNFEKLPWPTVEYPRYNIGKTDNGYKLEMALPGWNVANIDVAFKDGVLTVSGDKQETADNLEWLHKGISGKAFERWFKLDNVLTVKGAQFKDGMLTIDVEYLKETPSAKIPVEVAN